MSSIRRPRPRLLGALVALAVTSGFAAAPAHALKFTAEPSSCPTLPAAVQAFSAWGDKADYALVPGGAFEGAAPGWALRGTSLVAENEVFKVRDQRDRGSLAIAPGGSATSPAVCVGAEHPHFRLFARNTGGLTSMLKVELLYRRASGEQTALMIGILAASGHRSWAPSGELIAAKGIPLAPGETTAASFRFTAMNGASSWRIDDVFLDPVARR